ncbi:hypothetical protein ARALYDRAFT_911610 [Arabidopsis lyrata subsp. lyrata]|uniref:Uncharacterized protein n=1 Tax=Arabidopsis lyrata subsp. lyrata TaxID=81972 RepID=D7M0G0_ARALL|nr:hypothetical protein ARALYDRAFT_911610 [Arabidopsis lyrata subsp. lyrata]
METESCSIYLENLSGLKPIDLTRMTCSHVFHNRVSWSCSSVKHLSVVFYSALGSMIGTKD